MASYRWFHARRSESLLAEIDDICGAISSSVSNIVNRNTNDMRCREGIHITDVISTNWAARHYLGNDVYNFPGQDEMHRDNYGADCLHFAASEGHSQVTSMLLNYGADVNSIDDQGRGSLLLAAQCGRLESIRSLVEHGADVNLSAHNGE